MELTPEGKLTVDSDVTYDGKFSVQITTKVKLNLGQRFKAREVTVALAITLEHLEGKMIFRLKPPHQTVFGILLSQCQNDIEN